MIKKLKKFIDKNKIYIVRLSYLILFFTTLVLLFYKLDQIKISRWDEATNTQVVNELSQSDNIFLTQNHEPFLEKPPVWYFLTSSVVDIFGLNLFALRIVSAVSGLMIILTCVAISKHLFGAGGAIITWLSLLSNTLLFLPNKELFFTHTFRTADLDALFILFIISSYYFLLRYTSKKSTILSGILSGLAVLTKGPLGILPVVSLLLYRLYKKESIVNLFVLIGAFLLTTLPWHILMIFQYRELFISEYFSYHLITRAINPIEGHSGNVLSFFKIFSPILAPVSLFVWIAFPQFIKKLDRSKYLVVSAVFITLLIILFVQTRLPWYTLIVFPFLSIITGTLINTNQKYRKIVIFLYIFSSISIILAQILVLYSI